jgi:hypothetical protein
LNSDDAALRAQEMKWICVRRILRDICTSHPKHTVTCHCDASPITP